MAVLFKAIQANIANKAGKKLFYPRAVRVATVSTDQIAKEVSAYSSLTPGDVKNTIDNLVTVMTTHLQSSESVTLDGLGTFRMMINASGNGVESADEVSAAQASLTVRFQPASTRNLNRTVATRSLVTGVKLVRFDGASAEADESGNSGNGGTDDGVIDPTA